MRFIHATVLLCNILALQPAIAQSPLFLAAPDAIKIVMDGRPWNGLTADGRKARITLNKDGTGTFEGPITMSISWELKKDDICLNLKIAGTKCLRFRPVAGGYEAYNAGKLDLTFTR